MAGELIEEQPSLLSQIISEIEKLHDRERKRLLIQLRKEQLLHKATKLNAVEGGIKKDAMTDEQADHFLSEQRQLRYKL